MQRRAGGRTVSEKGRTATIALSSDKIFTKRLVTPPADTCGVDRTTALVQRDHGQALTELRLRLMDQVLVDALTAHVEPSHDKLKPANVAQVRQLSLLRYPGGKTWLVPKVRKWLKSYRRHPSVFVEPFAGGAIVSLTVAAESLAKHVVLAEIDEEVAAVWQTIFDGSDTDVRWLRARITSFEATPENVQAVLDSKPGDIKSRAWRTIIKNRMQRGGIMAAGAGLIREGENGRGLRSRWYPGTLARRIDALRFIRNRITFLHTDAFAVIRNFANDFNAFFFVDPPYTASDKKAGVRLYTYNEIDHEGLFALMAAVCGSVMMTYDDAPEVREMARRHGFRIETVPMKNTHHTIMQELLLLKP